MVERLRRHWTVLDVIGGDSGHQDECEGYDFLLRGQTIILIVLRCG